MHVARLLPLTPQLVEGNHLLSRLGLCQVILGNTSVEFSAYFKVLI